MTKYDPEVIDAQNTDLEQIVGKTIARALVEPIAPYYDDIPHLILIFDDGTSARITATYGIPTGA